MRYLSRAVTLSALIALVVLSNSGFTFERAQPAASGPQSIEMEVRTDGESIVWSYAQYYDFYTCLKPVGAGEPTWCIDEAWSGDVSGNAFVWVDFDGLNGLGLETGDPLPLPEVPGDNNHTSLSGDRLVWTNRVDPFGPTRILTVALSDPHTVEEVVSVETGVGEQVFRPAISGDRVLWGVATVDGEDYGWELWTTLIGGQPQLLLSGPTLEPLHGYDLHGKTVTYGLHDQVFVLDIDAPDLIRQISSWGSKPSTDGRYVFWSDWPLFYEPHEDRVLGYDLETNSYIGAEIGESSQIKSIWTSDGVVAWMERDGTTELVQSRPIKEILPSAPQPDPGTTSPDWLYFDRTGHYLSSGFKNFWVRSGGLPVFGYPMTTEYEEFNVDLGEFRTVQYTERQRFEYHPAYAGSPYETSLGRLGYADAERRGLLEHEAFQPVADPGTPGVEYVAATGHTMQGRFRDYWHRYGLDFGDAGISYRESLALFGYPISQEFVDPDTGLVTQYFERAVFEYHPDHREPYDVLLRRLGAEAIHEREW